MTEEQFSLFNAYINNELTPQQDIDFIALLNSNPSVMDEFETELMLRRGINKEEILSQLSQDTKEGLEPADSFIEHVTKALTQKSQEKKEAKPIVPFTKKYAALLAAAVIILIAVTAWLLINRPSENNIANNKKNSTDTTYINIDSPRTVPIVPSNDQTAAQIDPQQLYAENKTRYKAGDEDPAGASLYFIYYDEKNYDSVIKSKPEDYGTKGASDSSLTLYVSFYKALSYLETGRPANAATLFDEILKSTKTPTTLLYNAQWFRTLTALKQNNISTAQDLLKKIQQQKASPWHSNAIKLSAKLNGKE